MDHISLDVYKDFIFSIHKMNYIIDKLFSHELKILDNNLTFADLIALYQFHGEHDTDVNQIHYNDYIAQYAHKLAQLGYVETQKNRTLLTPTGVMLKKQIDARFLNHVKNLAFKGMAFQELSHILTILSRFEVFWSFILSVKQIDSISHS